MADNNIGNRLNTGVPAPERVADEDLEALFSVEEPEAAETKVVEKETKPARYELEIKKNERGMEIAELKQVNWVGPGTIILLSDLAEVAKLISKAAGK